LRQVLAASGCFGPWLRRLGWELARDLRETNVGNKEGTAMKPVKTTAACLVLLSVSASTQVQSGEARLQECRKLDERINHYTSLRRKGGAAGAMESWKKQLRKHEARFRALDCSDYRRELRRI